MLKRDGRLLGAMRRHLFRRFSYSQPEALLKDLALLSLTSALDEARGALAGSWWLHRTGRWMAYLVVGVTFVSAALVIGLVFYATTEVAMWLSNSLLNTLWNRTGTILSLIFTASVLVTVISAVIELAGVVSTYFSPGLRLGDPKDDILLNVKAYRGPGQLPRANQKRYGTFELLRGSRELLFHSRIYAFPPAIKDIAFWMREPVPVV